MARGPLVFGIACAALAASIQSVAAQEVAPDYQLGRIERVSSRGVKTFYAADKFDLSAVPRYEPQVRVSGVIRQWGNDYIVRGKLAEYWQDGFRKFHPDVTFDNHLKSSIQGIAGLYTRQADLAQMNRKILRDELLAYIREFEREPLEITVCTGSFDVAGWNFAYGVFVHKDNPINQLTMQQLDGIFGAERSGGWRDLDWDESLGRGPEQNIRTWGQLGLSGEWKHKPINVGGYNIKWPGAVGFANRVFRGGSKWNEKFREYMFKTEGETLLHPGVQSMRDLSNDRYGMVFNGIQYQTAQTKPIALANSPGGPYVPLTLENVQNRTYPLTNDTLVYVNRVSGQAIDPKVKEYLRFILSREGQEAVSRDGKYLPLTDVAFIRQQLAKLD